ncbi:type V CRISPR-associated protein Cas12k [Phormidium tenue]|uniref:Uncharacterized protein n=1 Tax=Phormidium tenue NIES-30 TaxID=549789 RepID=A0A1U7J637_9CYAN|nr:type V CRISPR-associated protein Cas12k [Phormidium tenue]MBD2232086.1 hypothetical protein [Phormidium tenue FACHB-1052]OKH48329.1 hypothetical protein NIES30_09845 [Phormidium tenue NIES-30]
MSIITIQCRLTASVATRQHLWNLMAHSNTPLVSELMRIIPLQPDFENWRQASKIPAKAIRDLCASFRKDERFAGQPGRFYSSASTMVAYTYDAWFALQASRLRRLYGMRRWLEILQSDTEMLKLCGVSWESFQERARAILQTATDQIQAKQPTPQPARRGNKKQRKQSDKIVSRRRLVDRLFQLYNESPETLDRCAIVRLLKNGCTVPEQAEQPERYQRMLLAKQTGVSRIERELASRLPKGRDLTDENFLNALELLTYQIPTSTEEFAQWKSQLLREPNPLPYPVLYSGNLNLTWFVEEVPRGKSQKPKQQICVKLNGLAKHVLKVQCDARQHHYFQRFVQDWDIYNRGKGPISGSLLLLRTASILWKPVQQSRHRATGEPWSDHSLYLHCQIDTKLLTQEGIEEKRQKKLASAQSSEQTRHATPVQAARQQGSLDRLQRSAQHPIHLPSRTPYQGQPQIILGVSFNLKHPVTVAVVDVQSQEVVKYHSSRQLLSTTDPKTDQSHLPQQQMAQQQSHDHERHKALKKDHYAPYKEANLGAYLNQVLAKRVVDIAIQFRVSSIVLPDTKGLRDKLEAQLRAKAASKIVGSVAAQKRYARTASIRLHHWSYNQLAELIKNRAAKLGIPVEVVPGLVADSPQATARDVVFSAYYRRQSASK